MRSSNGSLTAPILVVAWALGLPGARAHGPEHEQIEALTAQIAQRPKDAELYVRRGELHRAHGDRAAAMEDYRRAGALDPGRAEIDLLKGRALFESKQYLTARVHLDRYVAAHPDHPTGRLLRGQVLSALGAHAGAAADFAAAIERMPTPGADEYNALATALVAAGRPDEALAAYDRAIARFGSAVTLELPAIELELRAKRWDAALARVDRLLARAQRKESWLWRRGKILASAGRREEARRDLGAALAAIAALPPHLRGVKSTHDLEAEIRGEIRRLGRPE